MRIPPSIWLALLLPAAIASPLSAETPLFPNGDFSSGMEGWNLLRMENVPASAEVKDMEKGGHAICITVEAPGAQGYYVQLVRRSIPIAAGKTYRLKFRARSNAGANMTLNLWPAGDSEPRAGQQALWREDQVALTDTWKEYSFVIHPDGESGIFNLDFGGMAKQAGEYWFADVSLADAGSSSGARPSQ